MVLTFSILFPNIARDPQSFSDRAGLTEFSLLSPFMSKLLEGAFNRALDILPPRGIPSSPQDGPGRGPGVRALFFPSALSLLGVSHPPPTPRTISALGTLLVCSGCHNKIPQTEGRIQQTSTYFLTVLEAERSRCGKFLTSPFLHLCTERSLSQTSSSLRTLLLLGQDLTLMTSFDLPSFLKGPDAATLGIRASTQGIW